MQTFRCVLFARYVRKEDPVPWAGFVGAVLAQWPQFFKDLGATRSCCVEHYRAMFDQGYVTVCVCVCD